MKSSEPKRWRVEGVSDDGQKVTLGKYDTKDEAESDHTRIVDGGFYSDVIITAIKIDVDPADDQEGAPEKKDGDGK